MEQVLKDNDLSALVSRIDNGALLYLTGAYIQSKHSLGLKFNGEDVKGSFEVFEMIGAPM